MEPFAINELFKGEKYEEIISLWQDENNRPKLNDWDKWYVLLSFNKMKRYAETLNASHVILNDKDKNPDAEPWQRIYDAVGWALYYVHIRVFDCENGNKETFFSQVDFIVKHCSDSAYSPLNKTVMLVSKWMKDRLLGQTPDYQRMTRYLSAVNSDQLSMEEHISSEGKPYASDRELWSMRQVKALLETKQYDACLACADTALNAGISFHNNDDAWLRIYKGDCFFALGQMDQARSMYQEVLLDLQNPTVYQRLFQLEAREEHPKQALLFGARCGLSAPFVPEQDDKRVRFYRDFADYLELQGMEQAAFLHRRHALHIYASNPAWKLPEGLKAPEDLMGVDRRKTSQMLAVFWKSLLEQHTQWENGRVERLFQGDRAGLIEDDQHCLIYFSVRDYRGKPKDISPGLNVRFTREMRRNRKKGTVEPNAVMIEKQAN